MFVPNVSLRRPSFKGSRSSTIYRNTKCDQLFQLRPSMQEEIIFCEALENNKTTKK